MKIKPRQISFHTFCMVLIFCLIACGPSKDKNGDRSDEFQDDEKSLKEQIPELLYKLPPPTEIPYLLAATGAEFNASLINDKNLSEKYGAKTEKAALNLGVYTADIGYLTSYEKTQEAIEYIATCKNLADILGVSEFDIDLIRRFEENVSNKDSLTALLNQTLKKADKYLKDDGRNKLAGLIITGSFIEGLYVATALVKTYPTDLKPADRNLILTPLIRIILNQKESVGELLRMLRSVEQDDSVSGIIKDLVALQASYKSLNIDEQIKNNRGDLVLSDKNLTEITSIVEKIRNNITD